MTEDQRLKAERYEFNNKSRQTKLMITDGKKLQRRGLSYWQARGQQLQQAAKHPYIQLWAEQ